MVASRLAVIEEYSELPILMQRCALFILLVSIFSVTSHCFTIVIMESTVDAQYKSLCKTRQYLRLKISRFCNDVSANISSFNDVKIAGYLNKLNALRTDMDEINVKVNTVIPDGIDQVALIFEEESYNEKLFDAINLLKHHDAQSTSNVGEVNKLKLPVVTLPEYSNSSVDSLEKFFYEFESIIDKHKLSSYEKFVYLKEQLHDSAKVLIDSMSATKQKYETAYRCFRFCCYTTV